MYLLLAILTANITGAAQLCTDYDKAVVKTKKDLEGATNAVAPFTKELEANLTERQGIAAIKKLKIKIKDLKDRHFAAKKFRPDFKVQVQCQNRKRVPYNAALKLADDALKKAEASLKVAQAKYNWDRAGHGCRAWSDKVMGGIAEIKGVNQRVDKSNASFKAEKISIKSIQKLDKAIKKEDFLMEKYGAFTWNEDSACQDITKSKKISASLQSQLNILEKATSEAKSAVVKSKKQLDAREKIGVPATSAKKSATALSLRIKKTGDLDFNSNKSAGFSEEIRQQKEKIAELRKASDSFKKANSRDAKRLNLASIESQLKQATKKLEDSEKTLQRKQLAYQKVLTEFGKTIYLKEGESPPPPPASGQDISAEIPPAPRPFPHLENETVKMPGSIEAFDDGSYPVEITR